MHNIIFGIVLLALGFWGLTVWWWSFAELLRGLTPMMLILVGLVALAAGITEAKKTKRSEEEVLDD